MTEKDFEYDEDKYVSFLREKTGEFMDIDSTMIPLPKEG